MTVEKLIEKLSGILKEMPDTSVLAMDGLQGGRISVESIGLKRPAKSETTFAVVSDSPRIGRPMPAGRFLKILKNLPGNLEVVFDDLKGKLIPVEAVRAEQSVESGKSGISAETVLVVLQENPRSHLKSH